MTSRRIEIPFDAFASGKPIIPEQVLGCRKCSMKRVASRSPIFDEHNVDSIVYSCVNGPREASPCDNNLKLSVMVESN